MRPYEKKILDQRLKDFQKEVIPDDLFPYMTCLISQDKEEILAEQKNHGPIKATSVLVDRLKRRDKGFQDFVQALRKCGGEHTALLLDPYYNYNDDAADDETADADGSGLSFKRIGTAIDVKISGNLLPEGSEEQTESCCELERYVAERFKDQKSEENKNMRKELQKHLPQGTAFVDTVPGSIISTFRLSSEQAAKELWDMYSGGEFESMLQTVLVENTLKDGKKVPEKPVQLQLSLCVERFKKIREKLAEIDSEQENESLLSLPSDKENGQVDYDECEMEFTIPEVFLGEKANSLGPCELELREYQKELAEPAIKGKNTIICAPTNSGKTYVAIEIAKRHLDSFTSDADQSEASATSSTSRKEPRVVFIVSTVNLVLQQKERFEAFLSSKYIVCEISGANATEIPLKYLLQSHSVVVMTAQILVNALKSENKEERVELKDISLLLFDECHHAHKEHPYNSIMEKYLAMKFQPGSRHSLPQIIGLTASLGTGKAKSVEKAEEHIILVSANLDAEVISTVQKNKAELEKFANVPSQETHHVQKNEQDPFEKIISKVMDKIEARLKMIKGTSYKAGPPDKGGQQYRQWVEEFYKDSVAVGDRYLVTYAEHLREYNVALTLNTNTRLKNARRYLQKYFDSLDREKFTEIDKTLEKLFQMAMQALDKYIQKNGGEPQNPLLVKLKELLLENYKELDQGNKDPPNKAEDGRDNEGGDEGDGTSEDLTSDDSPEKSADNKEDGMIDMETTKTEDYMGNEITQEKGEETAEKLDKEEDANNTRVTSEKEKEADKKDLTLETKNDVPPEDASKDHESVEGVDAFNGVANEGADQKDSEVMDDHQENKAASTSLDTTQDEEDKPSPDERNAHHPEWEGPKGIVFSRTRESTEALLDWIKETEELNAVLRPMPLVGSGDGNIGMTQNEQERVIKRFKTGEKNLLLATTVAEEGLDISDCNYVIRYNMMGNEISSVQSRGRVRATEGKYSVLGQSGELKRERTSRFREILMTEALTKVQRINPETFTLKVKYIQRKSYQDRYLKKHMFAVEKSVFLPKDVTFLCRKCKEVACQAHDVRRIKGSHYVIINRTCQDKVDVKKHPNPKIIDDVEMNKKIFCKKCHEDWGVTALIDRVEWMCIKICSFVLEFPDQDRPRKMYKKWKDLPFGIKEADIEELLNYSAKKGPADDLLDVDFDP